MPPFQTEVIVIGAGWSGLAAASTYLRINPDISLTILDSSDTPGGAWSVSRLYPGLIANSPNGLYEYSDLSMIDSQHPVYELVPGTRIQSYLERYARIKGVYDKIRFGVHVVKVRRRGAEGSVNSGWTVQLSTNEVLTCDKLIVASGLHNKPKIPSVPQSTYTGTSIHSKRLGQLHTSLTSDPSINSVVVVGGCKSAVEALSLFLPAGKSVSWIIRPSEQGVPVIIIDPDMKPNLVGTANTRLFSVFGPSVFITEGFWYDFLHSGTWRLGTWLRKLFWWGMSSAVADAPNYGKSRNGELIRPLDQVTNFFYDAPYLSVVYKGNPFLTWLHDNENLKVYRASVSRLVGKQMELNTGETVPADAVVWCTGWLPSVDFFDPIEAQRLGIPVAVNNDQKDGKQDDEDRKWHVRSVKADLEVQRLLPQLRGTPRSASEVSSNTQFRLYRQILSPALLAKNDRSIAIVGMISSGQTAITSEMSALWAVAHMEDLLPPATLPSQEEMENDVAMVNAWMARRYGARGAKDPEIILECQSYLDVLMKDLGVKVERKRKGWWGWLKEWVMPYEARDYRGVVDEVLENAERRRKKVS